MVKYRMEQPDDGVLYFCSSISASQRLHFANVSGESSYTPRDVIQLVALPSSTQDNCYICSADYARTAGEGGGGGGGVSQEYVDTKVQEEATAREAADEAIENKIPTKTSQLSNDSGFLTHEGTIANADHASTANTASTADNVAWGNVSGKPTTLEGYGITDAATKAEIPTKTSQLDNDSGFLTKTGTIDNALSAGFASSTSWNGIADKPIASATELGLVKVGSNLTIDADGKLNATGGGTGGVSQEYVDGKVQEEATARQNADEALSAAIPTKTSQLSNDSGFLTHEGTIANAENANTANTASTANSVAWSGVQSKPTTLDGYGITDAATKAEVDSLAAVVGNANTQLEEIA